MYSVDARYTEFWTSFLLKISVKIPEIKYVRFQAMKESKV